MFGHNARGNDWQAPQPWGRKAYDGLMGADEIAHMQQERTEASYARMIDPVVFAWDCGLNPDPWQQKYLRSRKKRKLMNCSRQVGKSTTAAEAVVHSAIYNPGCLQLLVSKGKRQSSELMRKVYDVYNLAEDAIPLIHQGVTEIETAAGSRIVALPGEEGTVRSFSSVYRLVVDEASRVPDELYVAVRPMLAVSNGFLDALSTPFGTRGWWYEAVMKTLDPTHEREQGAEPPWDYYEVPANECPRLSSEFLQEEYETLGKWWFNQEYLCKFMDAAGQAFTAGEIERAFAEEVEVWDLGRVVNQLQDAWDGPALTMQR